MGKQTKERKEKKMNEDDLRNQINSLIRDEIQEVINDYVDEKEEQSKSGLGFVRTEEEKQLKVKVSNDEIDKIIKEPLGGAHYDRDKVFQTVKKQMIDAFRTLYKMDSDQLIEARRAKFSNMGTFQG